MSSVVLAVSLILSGIALIFFARKFARSDQKKIEKTPSPKPLETKPSEKTELPKKEEPKKVDDRSRVVSGLQKTKFFLQSAIDQISGSQGEKFYEELQDVLLSADVGLAFSESIVEKLKQQVGLTIPDRRVLLTKLIDILETELLENQPVELHKPHVIMIVGVNGAGKTTTVAKLCQQFQQKGLKVLVGAADTFRAAATEQLKIWIERVGAEGVFPQEGVDPSSVAYDTVSAAVSRGASICLIDTAGRLHTKTNLMEELKKMKRVITKVLPGAPHDIWLVLDGSAGQNMLNQAREFNQALGLTGLIITKLDGTSKGGAVFSVVNELKVPVIYIGVGEGQEDLLTFKRDQFVKAILGDM
ncbi:MAG: signal recognition particle-docking protein FtsY [Bacteriovoracia bacterium]